MEKLLTEEFGELTLEDRTFLFKEIAKMEEGMDMGMSVEMDENEKNRRLMRIREGSKRIQKMLEDDRKRRKKHRSHPIQFNRKTDMLMKSRKR